MSTKQWAIQDEDTGDWYVDGGWACEKDLARNRLYTGSYSHCAAAFAISPGRAVYREGARIVPAPPEEMTDDECWTWFRQNGSCDYALQPAYGPPGKQWFLSSTKGRNPAYGATPCDAIRAARRLWA